MIRTPSQLLESVQQSSIRLAVVACKLQLRIIDDDIPIILDAQLRANLQNDLLPVQLRLHVVLRAQNANRSALKLMD